MNQAKNDKTKIIIAIVVIIAIIAAFLGWRSYKNSPVRNPNNPLSNVNYTFSHYKDEKGLDDYAIENNVLRNVIVIMLKKEEPDSELLNRMKNSTSVDMKFMADGERDMKDHLLDTSGADDFELNSKEISMLNELRHILYRQNFNNNINLISVKPDLKNAKKGDTVEFSVNLPKYFVDKYGISLTPRKVKIDKIKAMP